MKKLYFVRHGLSEMNKAGMRSGRTDTPLAPEGITQAHQAGAAAKDLDIHLIVASPLKRAHHTARLIAAEIGYPEDAIILDELLVERDFGVLEGITYDPAGPISTARGVEPVDVILERARAVLEKVQMLPHENVLIVSHGSFGRALRHHTNPSQPFNDVSSESDRFPNATIVRLL